jgi:hypothetical protein
MFEMMFYPSKSGGVPPRRIVSDDARISLGLDFPRLKEEQPSRVLRDFHPGLRDGEREKLYTRPLVEAMTQALSTRVFFVTKGGRVGIPPLPPSAKTTRSLSCWVAICLSSYANSRTVLHFNLSESRTCMV